MTGPGGGSSTTLLVVSMTADFTGALTTAAPPGTAEVSLVPTAKVQVFANGTYAPELGVYGSDGTSTKWTA